jgi:hypothetical protein
MVPHTCLPIDRIAQFPFLVPGSNTIWHKDGRLIYVGMPGRGIAAETTRRNTPQGLYTRLQSHASGRRSGAQLCVYVADRLVCRPYLRRTSLLSRQGGIKWMHSCAATPMRTFFIVSYCCRMDQQLTHLRRRSRAVSGSMAVRFSIQRGCQRRAHVFDRTICYAILYKFGLQTP